MTDDRSFLPCPLLACLQVSSKYGFLGSIDANTGDELLGWDTDQFPMNVKQTMLTALIMLEQGGLGSGGLNFDAKVRRESTDIEDMFISHIAAMDCYAKGLKVCGHSSTGASRSMFLSV